MDAHLPPVVFLARQGTVITTLIENLLRMPGAPGIQHGEGVSVRVVGIREEGPYRLVRLGPDHRYTSDFRKAGQYITIEFPRDHPRYVVIANGPRRARTDGWELLIKPSESMGGKLEKLSVGDFVKVGPVLGRGFPDLNAFTRLIAFVTGSGVAAVRSVLHDLEDREIPIEVHLHYGEETLDHRALTAEFSSLNLADFRLWLASEDLEDGPRFVQESFRAAPAPVHGDTAIFLCGASIMIREVAKLMLDLGADPSHLYTNFE